MKRQYPILNNAFTRALLLFWCGTTNRELAKKHNKWNMKPLDNEDEYTTVIPKIGRCLNYTYVVADKNCSCGQHGEYKAFICDYLFNKMSAKTTAELKEFNRLCKLFDLHFYDNEHRAGVTTWQLHETFAEASFISKKELPSGVKPILLMENGSRVRGYWRRVGEVIEIYRPNPNCPKIYHPMNWRLAYRMGLCYI